MFKKYIQILKKSDWLLTVVVLFLVVLGLIGIYSIEATAETPEYLNFTKQVYFFAAGFIGLILVSLIDYRYLRTYSWVLFIMTLMLLSAVLLFGTEIRGTRGWFFIGELGIQPVEIAKIVVIIFISKFLFDWRAEIHTIKQLLKLSGLVILPMALVLLQPDFGSTFIIAAIFLGSLLIIKIKRSYLVSIALILLVVMIASWMFGLADYQKERVMTFLDPDRDPYGSGYNIKQSIIAVGSGNIFGRGLALGSQSRLDFLPVQETDFIFAVIAEQLGFVGSTLVIVFFTLLVYRLIKIARQVRDDFGVFILTGLIIYFAAQTTLNIGMNIGLLPVAGVPLPFVSYGGSSLIVSLVAIGIAQSVYIRNANTQRGVI